MLNHNIASVGPYQENEWKYRLLFARKYTMYQIT